MSYRARKIRIKRHEHSESRLQAQLDPYPIQCATESGRRHLYPSLIYCGTFAPRPGYEQDRSKYEH